MVAALQEAEREGQELRRREALAATAAAELAKAVEEVAPVHDAVIALTADLLAPMRTLELDAIATVLFDAEKLAEANARAARAETAAMHTFASAEAAWREERNAIIAARDEATVSARRAADQVRRCTIHRPILDFVQTPCACFPIVRLLPLKSSFETHLFTKQF